MSFFRRLIKLIRPGQTRSENHRIVQYNVYEARSIFCHLLRRAQRGEEIVIARHGEPIVKLVAYSHELTQPGILRAQMMLNLSDEKFVER